MAKRLLIVESPGKVKKLSQILGGDWIVRASCGHIRGLSNKGEDSLGFSIDGNRVKCNYIPRDVRSKETIQKLKSAAKQVREVVLATDPDREGETIAWHIKEELGLRQAPKRVTYSEITASAVREAIANPRELDLKLVGAGLCRDCLDKLVGYKCSPLIWKLNNGAKSVGRVQSATLHLICKREREIQTFVPQDYWNVWVDYVEGFRAYYKGTENSSSNGNTPEQETEILDDATDNKNTKTPESKRVLSEAEAKRLVEIARNNSHKVIHVEGKTVHRKPPPPFTTSTLQQAAGSKLKFSPDKTMIVAQKLYEAGLITYMRTDSVALSPEFSASARKWLQQNDPENLPNRLTKHRSSKSAQEAHEAIRPTDVFLKSVDLREKVPPDEFNLYVIIWKRAIASLCKDARIRKTTIITQSEKLLWQARGQVVEFRGYSRYWNNISKDSVLPHLQTNQDLTLKNAEYEKKQTQPPPRYSEPKLVQLMEKLGIGRPSTYSSTIATLKKRDYVQLIKKNLQPTTLGLEVDTFLQKALPDLLEAKFTATMEDALDTIALGDRDWQQYLANWNKTYLIPALSKAQTLIPEAAKNTNSFQHQTKNTTQTKAQAGTKTKGGTGTNTKTGTTNKKSRTRCPECNQFLSKIPSTKVKKKYFLKCTSGCENVVMFWNDFSKKWQLPRSKENQTDNKSLNNKSLNNKSLNNKSPNNKSSNNKSPNNKSPQSLTSYPCPVCKKPLEEHSYSKDGQSKTMLRCSDPKSRQDKKHKDVAYFHTKNGSWWSPKFGEL